MESNNNNSERLNEVRSFDIIREMIQVSRNKINQDGILFVMWGWVLFYISLSGYITRSMLLSFALERSLEILGIVFPVAAFVISIIYLVKQRKKVQTYIGVSLRYVWGSLFVSMSLVNLIQFNVLHEINFELQHPLFMVLMAFAVTVTGGILRHRLIIAGGIVFGLLAFTASYLHLPEQLLVESAAWVIAFIVPGHILYHNRERS